MAVGLRVERLPQVLQGPHQLVGPGRVAVEQVVVAQAVDGRVQLDHGHLGQLLAHPAVRRPLRAQHPVQQQPQLLELLRRPHLDPRVGDRARPSASRQRTPSGTSTSITRSACVLGTSSATRIRATDAYRPGGVRTSARAGIPTVNEVGGPAGSTGTTTSVLPRIAWTISASREVSVERASESVSARSASGWPAPGVLLGRRRHLGLQPLPEPALGQPQPVAPRRRAGRRAGAGGARGVARRPGEHPGQHRGQQHLGVPGRRAALAVPDPVRRCSRVISASDRPRPAAGRPRPAAPRRPGRRCRR